MAQQHKIWHGVEGIQFLLDNRSGIIPKMWVESKGETSICIATIYSPGLARIKQKSDTENYT
jgi:hypothetical protein